MSGWTSCPCIDLRMKCSIILVLLIIFMKLSSSSLMNITISVPVSSVGKQDFFDGRSNDALCIIMFKIFKCLASWLHSCDLLNRSSLVGMYYLHWRSTRTLVQHDQLVINGNKKGSNSLDEVVEVGEYSLSSLSDTYIVIFVFRSMEWLRSQLFTKYLFNSHWGWAYWQPSSTIEPQRIEFIPMFHSVRDRFLSPTREYAHVSTSFRLPRSISLSLFRFFIMFTFLADDKGRDGMNELWDGYRMLTRGTSYPCSQSVWYREE